MYSRIHSAVCKGIEGEVVYVEADIARGLPGIFIVGLASTMVMESRERIRAAIINSGLEYPRGRITVNLTPASLRKSGSGLDLPIAAAVLVSGMQMDMTQASEYGIIGELSLEGGVLGVSGILPMIIALRDSGIRKIIIPADNAAESSVISGAEIYPVRNLSECLELINTGRIAADMTVCDENEPPLSDSLCAQTAVPDFSEIRGQEHVKRALTIAVTGRHGILMVGSPGCGKTMLASRLPGIMPAMTERERIETAVIYSVAGKTDAAAAMASVRPFRNPHCSIGRAGLLGGGSIPVPGEITLAHNGVLFMDEVCEFDTGTIEALRTPIEEKKIVHFRKGDSYAFPCNLQLVMAANPCPCGYFGDSMRICRCSEAQLERYRKKLSGPMMDRIDMRISMEKVEFDELRDTGSHCGTSSADMRKSVEKGIDFAHSHGRHFSNADMSDRDIGRYCVLGEAEADFMKTAYETLKMTPRSYKKTLKIARTIADIAGSEKIVQEHLAEALSYRILDAVNE